MKNINERSWKDEIAVDSETGDIIKDAALYQRNQTIEERLNIKIVSIPKQRNL